MLLLEDFPASFTSLRKAFRIAVALLSALPCANKIGKAGRAATKMVLIKVDISYTARHNRRSWAGVGFQSSSQRKQEEEPAKEPNSALFEVCPMRAPKVDGFS